jgi:glycine/D-amino acid oxidase-like deaminating enzyme
MNLYSDAPFWLMRHGIVNSYPSLSSNLSVEIAVMGAGISGVLVADALCKKGYDVTILDRRHAGTGSTAASTSLLQYEIDTPLHKLIKMVGQKYATRSYELCRKAIYDVETLCRQFKDPDLFALKPSFQFASYQSHVTGLAKEFELRKKNGFRLQWLEEKDILNKFALKKPAGILSEDGAEANTYKLTHPMHEKNIQRGLKNLEKTKK